MQRHEKNYEEPLKLLETEQTKEEFYKWFENRGLLSDLRAYMRQLMVKALTDSNKKEKTLHLKKTSSSPKLQAINLLVVDYLFHEDYLYTVSVFSSEAQILDSMPHYSQYVTETVRERNWDQRSLPRFSRQEAEDILDTLHLPSSPHTLSEAVNLYLSGTESLFTCVVRMLSSSYNQSLLIDPRINLTEGPEVNKLWSQEMQDLLLMAGVKLQHIQRLQRRWSKTIEEEKLKVRKEVEEEELKVREEKERETKRRLRVELEEEMRAEYEELRSWQSRVEMREQGLANLANQLSAVNDDINQRLSELQVKQEVLEMKENHQKLDQFALETQFRILHVEEEKEHSSSSSSENVASTFPPVNGKLHQNVVDKKQPFTKEICIQTENMVELIESSMQTSEPRVTVGIQTSNNVDNQQQTSQEIQPDNQTLLQLQREQEKISELLEENLELRAHALQQRQRIDELTNRAASLSAQLEENRIAVAVLSGREEAQVANPVPPPPPFAAHQLAFVPTFGFNTPQRAGAGEESLFAPRPPQTNSHPDHRRRSLRFSFSQNQSPTSDESSHTDEVIQNARSRIQQLEEESAAVQRNYQAFQSRLLSSDPFIFPPLGPPRTNSSVVRVRRNDGISIFPLSTQPLLQVSNLQFQRLQPQEEVDNSSSDRAGLYESSRIESLTNSRRLFNQRNLRQFDRWKQFKKKFQRRDTLDQTRRKTAKQNICISSSEDENVVQNSKHNRERSRTRRVFEKRNEQLSHIENQSDSTQEIREGKVLKAETDKKKIEESINVQNNEKINLNNITTVENNQNEYNISPVNPSVLDQNARRSEKLIESLKVLLGKNEKRQTSNLSEGSLDLESLPRDSVNIIQENIEHCCLNKVKENSDKPKTLEEKDNSVHKSISKSASVNNNEMCANIQLDVAIRKEEDHNETQVTTLEPLTAPTTRLHIQSQSVENLDLTTNAAAHTPEEMEQNVARSSSVTSGSDILRELNSRSSTSVSVGFVESKHSSHFWD